MKQVIATLFCLLASAQAFAPVARNVAFTAGSSALNAVNMPKSIMTAAAAAAPAILSSTAAVATEGTNEWFGVDDLRLLAVLFAGHLAILSLWLGSYGDASEDEDFFGEIDYTGN
eukprot:CAMPEP_0196810632 /NCGR_PEP_ID=MMETSP1362-20130617/12656_1 /TAXON_ID=163516 /ORGANISM="Leptocylindrus danicus, Strain CCMP1856" /LENGTH=114 /DNA_ID=CAMNT_0042185721 /DNA_START=33 /DNA_END=377 /DNA_ORIENTATION=+